MSANFQQIAKDLGRQLQTRFPSLKKTTADDKPIDGVNLKDADARKFSFDFTSEEGEKIVNVTISLSEEGEDPGLDVQWSDTVDNRSWDRFIRNILPKFAQTHGLNFNAQNPSKTNLDKRDSLGENDMNESKLFGTSKTSYQEIGEAKIIVRHSQPVNLNSMNGRSQRIEHIYVENAMGERFLYPVKHLNGARALAQHVSHGGTPYDDIGRHVIGLSEELSKLRFFKNYVDRSPIVSESMGNIQQKVIERINDIKKQVHSLQMSKNYSVFKENFRVNQSQEVPEEVLNDWVDRLTVRSFNEELKTAFPYIYKLVDESELPVKEIDTEEDMLKTNDDKKDLKFKNKKIKELSAFESYLDQIVKEDDDLFDNNEELQQQAMAELKGLFGNELPLGTDGDNVRDSIKGIIDNNKLNRAFQILADLGLDEMDARPIIASYLKSHDRENGTDLSNKLGFDGVSAAPAVTPTPPAPPPEAAAPPAPPPEAAAPAAPPPEAAAPLAPPPEAAAPPGAAPGPMIPNPAPLAESGNGSKLVDEIRSRISGFFNQTEGTFTIGEEGFVTKMCKELKEKYHVPPGTHKAERFDHMVERACNSIMEKYKQRHNHSRELSDMRRMAGLAEDSPQQMLARQEIARAKSKADQLPNGQGSGTFSQGKLVNPNSTGGQSGPNVRRAGNDNMEEAGMDDMGGMMKGMMGGMDPQGMMKDIQSKIPAGNMKSSRTSSGTIDGKPASYDDAMGKFRGMAGDMGFDASGDDPVGSMYKGIQGKFGDMMKGMNMPSMPGARSSGTSMPSVSPTRADAAPDLKTALSKMKPTTPDQAMTMIADLKKLAGLA